MACDAQSLITAAMANGYAKLSDRGLLEALVASACAGSSSGGVSCGAGAPVAAPATPCAFYIDTNNGVIYSYYGGAWH